MSAPNAAIEQVLGLLVIACREECSHGEPIMVHPDTLTMLIRHWQATKGTFTPCPDCARLSAEVERHRGLNAVLVSNCERMREVVEATRELHQHFMDSEDGSFQPLFARLESALSRLDAAAKPTQDPEPCRVECSKCGWSGPKTDAGQLRENLLVCPRCTAICVCPKGPN